MKKLFSLVAMMFCVIAGWAQSKIESPTYYQLPASPYVFQATDVNAKVGNFQNWLGTSAAAWKTFDASRIGWIGSWKLDGETPEFTTDALNYSTVIDVNGSPLELYVQKISSVAAFCLANNNSRTFELHIYDEAGTDVTPEGQGKVTGDGSGYNYTLSVTGLDNTKKYKVVLSANKGNCWVQAVKFEGTPRTSSNFNNSQVYLEQNGNVIKAFGLAEGEVLRYKAFVDQDIPSGTSITGDDEEFPAKGYFFKPGTVVKLRVRAFDKNGNASSTWTHTYELPVPTISDNYVNIRSIKTDDLNEDGSWKNSIPEASCREWNKMYSNSDKVLWTTTGNLQYIYHVANKYIKRTALDGTEYEIPVVAMNRANTMYFSVEAPSYVKVTCATEYFKNPSNEAAGTSNAGTGVAFDGVEYTLDENGCFSISVEPGVHTFTIPNKRAESAFQMLEIMRAATVAPGTDLAAFVKENAALIATQKFAPIVLQEGEYTLNDELVIPISAYIDGNGAKLTLGENGSIVAANDLTVANMTVDASASSAPFLALSATPVVPEVSSYYRINEIKLANVTATGLKNSLLYDNDTKYCVVNLVIDNCVLGLATTEVKNEALISFQQGGAKDFTIKNSTVYGNGDVAKYFIRYNNSARLDRYGFDKNTEFQTMTYLNNTFYNLLKTDGQWGNYSGIAGQNYIKYNVQNNIWYNASNEVIRRMAGGRFGGNAPLTFAKNTYFYNGVNNSEKEASYDKSEDILTTDPMFKNAVEGDFTPNASTEQVLYKTGDPRWVAGIEYVAPVEAPATAKYFWAANAAGYVTEVGGKATANEAGAGRVNYPNDVYYTISLNGAKDFSSAVVTVTLDNALAAGDVIKVTAYQNKDAEGKKTGVKMRFNGDNNNTLATADDVFNNIHPDYATGDGKPNTVELTVTEAQAGCTSFEMTRVNTGTNCFITVLEIIPYEVVVPVENAIAAPAAVNSAIYNLAGQKVGADYKGIVIKNGKKYMVK